MRQQTDRAQYLYRVVRQSFVYVLEILLYMLTVIAQCVCVCVFVGMQWVIDYPESP